MEIIKKKIWETPVLKDLNVKETESGSLYATTEAGYFGPSGVAGT